MPRPTIPHSSVFPGSGLVYKAGEPMPTRVARLLPDESAHDYESDGAGNWVLKAPKEKPNG